MRMIAREFVYTHCAIVWHDGVNGAMLLFCVALAFYANDMNTVAATFMSIAAAFAGIAIGSQLVQRRVSR